MISFLAGDFFARSPLLAYPLLALAIFVSLFAAVLWRTLRQSRERLHTLAHLPFDDAAQVHVHVSTEAAFEALWWPSAPTGPHRSVL
ncbi:MAG: hypothetical protein ACPGUV_07520, partial [Polyangiales bacterium]